MVWIFLWQVLPAFFIAQFIFFPIRHFKSEKKSAKKIAIRKFYA